jgi:uncharacterized protein (TIGR02001 family)
MRQALLTSILLAGSALAAAPALADDAPAAPTPAFTITGAADLTSQYRFRGISQSDNKPAIQGTFTITHSSGLYFSVWGSSATGNAAVDIGGTEIDVYAGYSHTFAGPAITLDGGLYGYIYPGSDKTHFNTDSSHLFTNSPAGISENYFEIYADASKTFGPVTGKAGINFAPNQSYFKDFGTKTRHNVYVFGELGLTLPNFPITFHSHVGHTAGGFDYFPIGQAHGHQYIDYTVGASYKWKALTFDVSVVGTDLSKRDTDVFLDDGEDGVLAVGHNDFRRAAKSVVVGTVTASF